MSFLNIHLITRRPLLIIFAAVYLPLLCFTTSITEHKAVLTATTVTDPSNKALHSEKRDDKEFDFYTCFIGNYNVVTKSKDEGRAELDGLNGSKHESPKEESVFPQIESYKRLKERLNNTKNNSQVAAPNNVQYNVHNIFHKHNNNNNNNKHINNHNNDDKNHNNSNKDHNKNENSHTNNNNNDYHNKKENNNNNHNKKEKSHKNNNLNNDITNHMKKNKERPEERLKKHHKRNNKDNNNGFINKHLNKAMPKSHHNNKNFNNNNYNNNNNNNNNHNNHNNNNNHNNHNKNNGDIEFSSQENVDNEENVERSDKTLILTIPPRPTLTAMTDNSVLLKWHLPSFTPGSLSIEFIKIQYKEVPSKHSNPHQAPYSNLWGTVDDEISPDTTKFIVNKLKMRCTYVFRLAVVYSNGDNRHSRNSNKFTVGGSFASLKYPRFPPLIVELKAMDADSLSVTWQQAQEPNIRIQGFELQYKEYHINKNNVVDNKNSVKINNNYQEIKIVRPASLNFIISYLQPKTQYSVRIRSYNKAGKSDFSNVAVKETLGLEDSPVTYTYQKDTSTSETMKDDDEDEDEEDDGEEEDDDWEDEDEDEEDDVWEDEDEDIGMEDNYYADEKEDEEDDDDAGDDDDEYGDGYDDLAGYEEDYVDYDDYYHYDYDNIHANKHRPHFGRRKNKSVKKAVDHAVNPYDHPVVTQTRLHSNRQNIPNRRINNNNNNHNNNNNNHNNNKHHHREHHKDNIGNRKNHVNDSSRSMKYSHHLANNGKLNNYSDLLVSLKELKSERVLLIVVCCVVSVCLLLLLLLFVFCVKKNYLLSIKLTKVSKKSSQNKAFDS